MPPMTPSPLPGPIPPGATIGVFAPASLSDAPRQAIGVRWIESRGYTVKLAPAVTSHRPSYVLHPLHAAPAAARAADLEQLWFDPEVDALLAVRGGAGTLGLLEHLDLRRMARRPKLLIGMSDLTALQCALWAAARIPGIAGPMVVQLARAPRWTRDHWLEALRVSALPRAVPLPDGMRPEVLRRGEAEGTLLPCNLSLLTRLIGTRHMPDLRGSILLLEDVRETPASIDRMVSHLALSGVCRGLAGIVLGQFTRCDGRERGVTRAHSEVLLRGWARSLGVPAIAGFPHGHERLTATLPFGARARLFTRTPFLSLMTDPWGGP